MTDGTLREDKGFLPTSQQRHDGYEDYAYLATPYREIVGLLADIHSELVAMNRAASTDHGYGGPAIAFAVREVANCQGADSTVHQVSSPDLSQLITDALDYLKKRP